MQAALLVAITALGSLKVLGLSKVLMSLEVKGTSRSIDDGRGCWGVPEKSEGFQHRVRVAGKHGTMSSDVGYTQIRTHTHVDADLHA